MYTLLEEEPGSAVGHECSGVVIRNVRVFNHYTNSKSVSQQPTKSVKERSKECIYTQRVQEKEHASFIPPIMDYWQGCISLLQKAASFKFNLHCNHQLAMFLQTECFSFTLQFNG